MDSSIAFVWRDWYIYGKISDSIYNLLFITLVMHPLSLHLKLNFRSSKRRVVSYLCEWFSQWGEHLKQKSWVDLYNRGSWLIQPWLQNCCHFWTNLKLLALLINFSRPRHVHKWEILRLLVALLLHSECYSLNEIARNHFAMYSK